MKNSDLIHLLHQLATQGIWALSGRALCRLMQVPPANRSVSLARSSRDGFILRLAGGFYRNTLASLPHNHLEILANWLRPNDWFYLSQESALHEAGYLPQVPNRLTFVTTGRSYVYHTPLGILEFTHTERSPDQWWNQLTLDWRRGLRIAEPILALADLQRSKRNMDLVNDLEV
jgi:hypothetical protein